MLIIIDTITIMEKLNSEIASMSGVWPNSSVAYDLKYSIVFCMQNQQVINVKKTQKNA